METLLSVIAWLAVIAIVVAAGFYTAKLWDKWFPQSEPDYYDPIIVEITNEAGEVIETTTISDDEYYMLLSLSVQWDMTVEETFQKLVSDFVEELREEHENANTSQQTD